MEKFIKYQIIGYKPGDPRGARTPCIKIANKMLVKCGFAVGSKIKITYENEKIIIAVNDKNY